jgi:hypothetical protein
MFKQKCTVLQSYRSLRALQFLYKLYLHPISYVKIIILYNYIIMQKKKKRVPVSDPNIRVFTR